MAGRVRIKICGVMSADIARVAAEAGADAIGLVFHRPSRRYIAPDAAAEIARALPAFVHSVAVLVNPDADFVRELIARVRPDYLQFHGDESAEFCRGFGLPYIKALRVAADTDAAAKLREFSASYADASCILLDADAGSAYGGGGVAFDWAAVGLAEDVAAGARLMLAGGLDAANVGRALAMIPAFAVDVSSGVETEGEKDAGKVRGFCAAVGALTKHKK